MKRILVMSIAALFIFACKKKGEPEPLICVAKDNYKVKDTIAVSNCSKKYIKERWILPDGTQTNNSTVYFVPPTSGTYRFTLFVSNDKFVNEYQTYRDVTVTP